MKKIAIVCLIHLVGSVGLAQSPQVFAKLKQELARATQDTSRSFFLVDLARAYNTRDLDSSLWYTEQASLLNKKTRHPRIESKVLNVLGMINLTKGEIPKALELQLAALQIAREHHYPYEEAWSLFDIGNIYWELKDYSTAITYYKNGRQIMASLSIAGEVIQLKPLFDLNMGTAYQSINQLDSALFYLERALMESKATEVDEGIFFFYGDLQTRLGNYPRALEFLKKGMATSERNHSSYSTMYCYYCMANYFKQTRQLDSSIFYAQKILDIGGNFDNKHPMLRAYNLLAEIYEPFDLKQAHYYLKQAKSLSDKLFGLGTVRNLQRVIVDEQNRIRKIEAKRIAYQSRLKVYVLLTGLAILLLIAFLLNQSNHQKQKSNAILEKTLQDLRSTQAQLIQSEKLASLGELTAGIAHEIQNPLNFVNNFAEVSAEMLGEMEEELDKGDTQEAKAIAADLKTNLEKINHHGQRASSIVKGMLEHSRASTGVKEPTDLNALADEYLRLAYHGLRAKDSNFNVTLETHFDPELPLVSVVPQDMGRVLLNLINNAFYAVHQRTVETLHATSLHAEYQPTVTISTQKTADQIIIKVQDNGNGIPEAIREKIFQPFFTTKPTGQGTGLGLSLAYDIVTKGHSGHLEVKTKEGEGTLMIIRLPFHPA